MIKLTAERWKRLEELFRQAMEMEGPERESFVAFHTAGDEELRSELAGMLSYSGDAGKSIVEAIAEVAGTVTPPGSWIGRRFGPYQLLREIGRGGMGLVFEAVRDDDQFRQRVALKVAPEWRDSALLHERIRHERQILAELEHPNIARLLDGGTEDGVPYFAMEFVEGRPITEYVVAAGLSIRERVELFRQVLGAVHSAHEALIVHRDLKPSNILVNSAGIPKLLDFGIAKMLNPTNTGAGTATAMMWTPDYTSPEQVRGKVATVRTDVYSLGLVLYELLCGERGQSADMSTPLSLDQSICEVQPALPSERLRADGEASNEKLAQARQLEGDLDTIVSMAIRKEPERRYASAAELSADLGRYLEGRPVVARPGTFGYRAGKYVRRHRGVVAAGLLLIASVTAGVVATVHQARRAERRFEQVRKLANTFVFDVHDRIESLPGSTEARKVILQTALTYLENLREDAGGDKALLRELAAAYDKVGDAQGNPTQSNIGDRTGAIVSYRRAEAILESLVKQGDRNARPALAWAHMKIGMMVREQDAAGALREFQSARQTIESVIVEKPHDKDVLDTAGNLYSEMTRLLFALKDKNAADVARRSMEVARELVSLDPASAAYRIDLAAAYGNLGTAELGMGKLEEAVRSYRSSVELRERVVREKPDHVPYRRSLMIGYGYLGDVLGYRLGQNIGDIAGAISSFERALENARWLSGHDPADRKALFDVASAQLRLGSVLLETKTAAALECLKEAEGNLNRLLAEDATNNRFRYNVAIVHRKMGEALAMLGRKREAERRLEQSIAEALPLNAGAEAAAARLNVALARVRLALLRAAERDPRAALLAQAVAGDIAKPPAFFNTSWNQATMFADLGRIYQLLGRSQDAAEWFEKSLQAWKDTRAPQALAKRRADEVATVEKELVSLNRKPLP